MTHKAKSVQNKFLEYFKTNTKIFQQLFMLEYVTYYAFKDKLNKQKLK